MNLDAKKHRLRIIIHGAVQGVGFRPFVYRLAMEMGLAGWVRNSTEGVLIEVEGHQAALEAFLTRLQNERPALSYIHSIESSYLDLKNYQTFEILRSKTTGLKTVFILPDIATCPDCLHEIFDTKNRRYLYPFTNCTHCGPRFSIIEKLPYDRPNTTMKRFVMCESCKNEYENPGDRRFHAQPNACRKCGPYLELWDKNGEVLDIKQNAMHIAVTAILDSKIVAVKGLGGFHLMVDARNEVAVERLREFKQREEKPFALMYPALALVKEHCLVSTAEERLLCSPASPILLLQRAGKRDIADSVTKGNPNMGIMLPYTPLHHILLRELGFPVVATSGNLADEPICTDEHEALERLKAVADLFLVHNRPIRRYVDDSIARVVAEREMILRRARGYAPLPVVVKENLPPLLAVGAHLKNTVAVSSGNQIFISQHIGDLETLQANEAFQQVIADLQQLYEIRPEAVACDAHPDYFSTQFARKTGLPVVTVQHHYAHVLACMVENEIVAPVLGVSWDGTGFGLDGTVWGGEFFQINENDFNRCAHLRTFGLPGGDKAIKEPRRIALGLLFEIFGAAVFEMRHLNPVAAFTSTELFPIKAMLEKSINSPLTSSAGRLFDAVAAICGLRQKTNFEGQTAMELEFATGTFRTDATYSMKLIGDGRRETGDREAEIGNRKPKTNRKSVTESGNRESGIVTRSPEPETRNSKLETIIDWQPMILEILDDVKNKTAVGLISAKFHNTLCASILAVARLAELEKVILSGGCFQNKYLTERTVAGLLREGFRPYWQQRIPPNDGGIAVGQIIAAERELRRNRK